MEYARQLEEFSRKEADRIIREASESIESQLAEDRANMSPLQKYDISPLKRDSIPQRLVESPRVSDDIERSKAEEVLAQQ